MFYYNLENFVGIAYRSNLFLMNYNHNIQANTGGEGERKKCKTYAIFLKFNTKNYE